MINESTKPIPLTPYQAVMIHGWLRPILVLQWKHVLLNKSLTWPFLRSLDLSAESLKKMQPDPNEWANHTPIHLHYCRDMVCFPVHPIHHLHAGIEQIIHMRCAADELASFGVTYQELVKIGMSPDIMVFFGYKIVGWQRLGMTIKDLKDFNNNQLSQVFSGMTKNQIYDAFRNTQSIG